MLLSVMGVNSIMEDNKDKEILLDIRQKMTWGYYVDPKSETFGNAYRSGLKAGYAESYASTITTAEWFKAKILRMNLLGKAEKVLNKTLDMDTQDGEGKEKADLLRVQNDAAKFVAKTLGKDEGYNERTEISGANGQPIVFMPASLMDKYSIDAAKSDEVAILEDNK
jgi:hypothetical protein